MAKIVPSALLTSIAGKLGSVVAANWKGVPYVRSVATTISNPQTASQARQRAALSELSKVWTKDLSPAQKAGWETFATELGAQQAARDASIGGQGIIKPRGTVMSGYNAFISTNLMRESVGYAIADNVVTEAPLGIAAPGPVMNFAAAYDPASGCIQASYDDPIEPGPSRSYVDCLDQTKVEQSLVRIWLQRHGSYSSINQIKEIDGAGAGEEVCICTSLQYGVELPLVDGLYTVQADVVSPYGLSSPPSGQIHTTVGGCCTPDMPLTGGATVYAAGVFPILVTKASLDGACPADFVRVLMKDTNGDDFSFTIPREDWTDAAPNYQIDIPWPSAPTGDYQLAYLAGTMCGKLTACTTPETVNIPV